MPFLRVCVHRMVDGLVQRGTLGEQLIGDSSLAALLSRGLVHAGVIAAKELADEGPIGQLCVFLDFSQQEPELGHDQLHADDVVRIVREGAPIERPHPRHHGYSDDFGSPR